MTRVWLIGEAPGSEEQTEPFTGRSGKFLSHLGGFEVTEVFQCFNLLPEYPGASPGGGADFPLDEARISGARLTARLPEGSHLILCGSRVMKVMGVRRRGGHGRNMAHTCFRWRLHRRPYGGYFHLAVMPHPSGLNRLWNDPQTKDRGAEFLRSARELTKAQGQAQRAAWCKECRIQALAS